MGRKSGIHNPDLITIRVLSCGMYDITRLYKLFIYDYGIVNQRFLSTDDRKVRFSEINTFYEIYWPYIVLKLREPLQKTRHDQIFVSGVVEADGFFLSPSLPSSLSLFLLKPVGWNSPFGSQLVA